MSRKNTRTLNSIRQICQLKNLDEQVLYIRSRQILSAYRDICWSTIDRAEQVKESLVCYCGTPLDGALIYLETFAPEEAKAQFEERVRTLFETRWMIGLMEDTMIRVKEYPYNGTLYYEILSKCYLTRFRYQESKLLELLNLERSTFYDKKKEAILIFGISLWGSVLPGVRNSVQNPKKRESKADNKASFFEQNPDKSPTKCGQKNDEIPTESPTSHVLT